MSTIFSNKNFTGQRRSEPLMFWVALLLGSVFLHAVALLAIRLGAVGSVNAVEREPISVELIEVSPIVESPKPVSASVSKITKAISPNSVPISETAKEPTKTVLPKSLGNTKLSQIKSNQETAKTETQKQDRVSRVTISPDRAVVFKKGASQPSVSSRSTSKLKVAAKPVAVRSPAIKPAPKPTVAAKPVAVRSPAIKPAPKPTVAAKPVAVRSPAIKPAPKPTVAVKPVAVRSPAIKPAPKPTVAVKPVAVRSPTPKPTAASKPTEKRSQPVRAMPYPTPTPKKGDRESLPSTPQPPENQHSTGVLATFDLGSIRSGDRDIPEQLAVPEQNQRQFPSVLNPLQLGLNQSSAVILQVLVEIDDRGRLTAIKEVNVVEDSRSPQSTAKTTDYLGIAKQLLKDWEFHPAYSGGQPVYSELWLRLTVKAL